MEVTRLALSDVLLLTPRVFEDERGAFFESWRADSAASLSLPALVQENHSTSVAGVLRGLHYQLDRPQAKLVRVVRGAVLDVAVDIRRGSPTFGRWVSAELSAANRRQMFVPAGFAHGFCVIDGPADVIYKCSDYYSGAADQRGVAWDDKSLAIPWPTTTPLLSDKDRTYLPLHADRSDLPRFVA